MKIAAIIQARMGSTRLPGKVLRLLCGKTVLARVVERVQKCARVDEVVVATSISPLDDAIEQECAKLQILCVRGSEDDVLSRYQLAAEKVQADIIVRITADCPLFDPDLLEKMLEQFLKTKNCDYLSNTLTRSFPRGLDAEIFSRSLLNLCVQEAKLPHQREHVTPFIYENPQRFQLHNYANEEDLSSHRWTLDTTQDWTFIEKIYSKLLPSGENITTQSILELLKKEPELITINADVVQKTLHAL